MAKQKQTREDRSPFSRDEIIHEVRLAALGMASHIAVWGHRKEALNVASHYLGVELDGYDYEGDGHPQLASIPIEEHFLYTVVMDAYDHAYQCGDIFDDTFTVDERMHEVAAVLTGFPQTDFNGEPTPLNGLNPQKLRQVLETFFARCTLDNGGNLTVPQLALLANMGEAAVRTSLSAEGIKTISSQKGEKNQVPHADAIAWLSGRRNFVPTRRQPGVQGNPGELASSLFAADSLTFETALQKAISANYTTIGELAQAAGVSSIWIEELQDTSKLPEINLDGLQKLASALQAPVPLFAGRAVAALLERRSKPAAGHTSAAT
ncbi:hypothetical protein V6L76_07705 [Pannonibacter sp. Pt2]|uniref:HTH cro/C1-type domain-containing protein n=1 Tax=Pannonibacter anstelovis TaxID=3121537 RepID=A0ABU7ZM45_9HYPH